MNFNKGSSGSINSSLPVEDSFVLFLCIFLGFLILSIIVISKVKDKKKDLKIKGGGKEAID